MFGEDVRCVCSIRDLRVVVLGRVSLLFSVFSRSASRPCSFYLHVCHVCRGPHGSPYEVRVYLACATIKVTRCVLYGDNVAKRARVVKGEIQALVIKHLCVSLVPSCDRGRMSKRLRYKTGEVLEERRKVEKYAKRGGKVWNETSYKNC